MPPETKKILIVGGGFGGISAARALAAERLKNLAITLVSDKPHFEYYPALYRLLTEGAPREICIPLAELSKKNGVAIVEDRIVRIGAQEGFSEGASGTRYAFDYLILALGSETAYFDIPGLEEHSFGFKSLSDALRLKRHIQEKFAESRREAPEEKTPTMHFVVIGGGPIGVELAGELAVYTKMLAETMRVDPSLVTIDLIEAASRLVPSLPARFSARIERRLRALGVNIFLNRKVIKEEVENVFMKDMRLETETVIWTAGITPNRLYRATRDFTFDLKGRVSVNEHLQARGLTHIFVIGDGASTPHSGMAQTAIRDGTCAGKNIARLISGRPIGIYKPKKPFYSIPVGTPWAATLMGPIAVYGGVGWVFRQLADLGFFMSMLPVGKAIKAFRGKKMSCEAPSPISKK